MSKKIIHYSTFILMLCCLIFCLMIIKAGASGKFQSVASFQQYIASYGIFAPLMLTLVQAAQVVLPVLPGFLGCAVGAIMFGSSSGFWCNYIGISAGSIMAFALARKYGYSFVKELFKSEKYNKWTEKVAHSKSYAVFLFIATLLPLFPDDYLCYLAGLTNMSLKRFVWIIVLGKPWCILAYSLGFSLIR